MSLKESFQITLHAIERLTAFEIDSKERAALKEVMPLIESSYKLLEFLENILNVSTHTSKKDINEIEKLIYYAKNGKLDIVC